MYERIKFQFRAEMLTREGNWEELFLILHHVQNPWRLIDICHERKDYAFATRIYTEHPDCKEQYYTEYDFRHQKS